MSQSSPKGFIVFISFWFKVLVVSAKTFVFSGTFWANGNFNLPGVPSDTDDVVIHQRLCIINNHVDAVCRDLILTEDNLVLQKNSTLTVHGETTVSASLTKAEIDVAENATVSFLGKVNLNSQYYDDYAKIIALNHNSTVEFYESVVVYPYGSIIGEIGSSIILKGSNNKIFPFSKTNFSHLIIETEGTRRLDQSIKPGNNLGEYNGSITIKKGTLSTDSYSIIGNPNGFITIKGGGNLTLAGNLGFPLTFGNINIEKFSKVTYGKIGNQNIDSLNFWNLTIGGFGTKSCIGKTTVNGILTLNFGKIIPNNYLTLLSNPLGTASINTLCPSCEIEGTVKMQRMMPYENPTLLAGGWLSGNTFLNWSDSLTVKGISGSSLPTSSVKTFQYFTADSLVNGKGGFYSIPNISDSIYLGKGIILNTDTNKPITLLMDGKVFKGDTTFHFGSSAQPKMNFISNPYPSALLFFFENFEKKGCYNPFTLDHYGNYVPIQNGDTLHVGEGFFLMSQGTNPYFEFSEIYKVGSPGKTRFGNGKNLNNGLGKGDLVFELQRPDGSKDFSKIVFTTDNQKVGLDTLLDGLKIPNLYGKANIATVAARLNFGLNYIPRYHQNNLSIPIRVWSEGNSTDSATYQIAIKNIANLQQQNICIQLVDKAENQLTPITKDTVFAFSKLESDTSIRFVLALSNPIALTAKNVLCKLDSNGSAVVTLSLPNQSFLWKTLSDTVKYGSSIGFNDEVNHLYPGTYKVSVLNHPSCGTITETFEITEPDSLVEVSFKPNRTSAKLNKGAEFIFTNHSFGAKKYIWSFGDGDSLTQSYNATHTYLSPGNFIAKLIAERDQCTKTDSAFIEVIDDTFVENLEAYEGLTVKAVSKNTLIINSLESFNGAWQLVDLTSRLVQQGEIRLSPNTPELLVFNNLTGVYIFSAKNQEKNISISKKVFISQ